MRDYSLDHVEGAVVLRNLKSLVARGRGDTAIVLAHIAVADGRALYLGAGYPSMHAYCVEDLGMSDDEAYRRITAARAARRFPQLFTEVAEGRLHLAGVGVLAPYLTSENFEGLIAAAAGKRKSDIEQLIARRFSRPSARPRPQIIREMPTPSVRKLVPGRVDDLFASPQPVAATNRADAAPTPVERFDLRFSIGKEMHNRLRYAQRLLSHSIPDGDLEKLFDRALVALIAELEKRKFGATARPRPQRASARKRNVPAHIRGEVWKRDQGQCTFVSDTGHRCPANKFLEYDHIDPVALGGETTVDNIRLRCDAHNQFEAERVYGKEFVQAKREARRRRSP